MDKYVEVQFWKMKKINKLLKSEFMNLKKGINKQEVIIQKQKMVR